MARPPALVAGPRLAPAVTTDRASAGPKAGAGMRMVGVEDGFSPEAGMHCRFLRWTKLALLI
jgi:hypothetical protein